MEVEIWGRNFWKFLGQSRNQSTIFLGSRSMENVYVYKKKRFEIIKNSDFRNQNAILLILIKLLKSFFTKIGLEEVVEEVPRADIL